MGPQLTLQISCNRFHSRNAGSLFCTAVVVGVDIDIVGVQVAAFVDDKLDTGYVDSVVLEKPLVAVGNFV